MSMKYISLVIGLFSVIAGSMAYDPEIKTAAMPIITGLIVIILALCGLIPEIIVCERCGKKSLGTKGHCRHCEDRRRGE
jgi:hypothetical protein